MAGYDAQFGPHPPRDVIDRLLRATVALGFNCVQTYGVLNGLDYTFDAARAQRVKVFAIIWLEAPASANDASIRRGIEVARAYPDTIVRISCGSEVRTRLGAAIGDPIVQDCLGRVRAAGVAQPLTANDTWWMWCNGTWPCQPRALATEVDWIGINVFPWWENKFSGLFPCTTAENAPAFQIARMRDIRARYPGKEVVLTEYGWPGGPEGHSERNIRHPEHSCGVAGRRNQALVRASVTELEALGWLSVFFEAVMEPWKARPEGPAGPFWGLISGVAPRPPQKVRIAR